MKQILLILCLISIGCGYNAEKLDNPYDEKYCGREVCGTSITAFNYYLYVRMDSTIEELNVTADDFFKLRPNGLAARSIINCK